MTSEGRADETCGWVVVAEASQFNGGCCTSVMVKDVLIGEMMRVAGHTKG